MPKPSKSKETTKALDGLRVKIATRGVVLLYSFNLSMEVMSKVSTYSVVEAVDTERKLRRDVRKKRARIRDIHAMLKKERNRRVAAETENDKLHDKVNSLTKHIEKLMAQPDQSNRTQSCRF